MVMMPLFGDQGDNVKRLVSRGVGVVLNFYDITADVLVDALDAIINDSRWDICPSIAVSTYSCLITAVFD